MLLRRDDVAVRVVRAATIVALAGRRAASQVAVVERTDHEAHDRQAEERRGRRGHRTRGDVRDEAEVGHEARAAGAHVDEVHVRPAVLERRVHTDRRHVLRGRRAGRGTGGRRAGRGTGGRRAGRGTRCRGAGYAALHI